MVMPARMTAWRSASEMALVGVAIKLVSFARMRLRLGAS
jgi:hypothetical protein